MKILICNVGSTSLKYKLFVMDREETVAAVGGAERVGTEKSIFYREDCRTGEKTRRETPLPTHREAISVMLECLLKDGVRSLDEISCVGFKVVHAKNITGVQFLTEDVIHAMEAFNAVAPAHNPPYIAAIRQFRSLMPNTPLIGSFETAFHASMPPEAYLYSIPADLSKTYAIRRYGFHGASHEYMSDWVAKRMKNRNIRLVSCHLGGSGSLAAVKNGVSIDTSLGMSLQCGVMHNNRIGDIDPYIIFYLAEECGMTLEEIKDMLQTKSGLYGMSGGLSNDLRDIEEAAAQGNEDAANAVKAYAYSIKKYIGSYMAAMGGLDAIVFGGGIGRNSAAVRSMALLGLDTFGVELDQEKNRNASGGMDISADGSKVRIYLVDTNEELIVARKAMGLLKNIKNKVCDNNGGR